MAAKATYTAKNLVLVGGPCKNTVVADLAATGAFPYTCANWPAARNFGLIKVIDGAYVPGKVVVVAAGTTRAETNLACAALQLYDTKLAGQTASTVEVTGTVDSPVITAV
jgi:S-layer protein (TIGR01564 family)